MAILALPVDQRVIDIDSRRFASIEKALVELITNSDDSYSRLEKQDAAVSGNITINYERYQNGAVLTVSDQSEGMTLNRLRSVLSYGGAHSLLARGESSGRGYFGRGLKQAVYGLGHGWIESLRNGRYARVDLFRSETGGYVYDDWDGDREAAEEDFAKLEVPIGGTGTKVTIVVENPSVGIPYFRSLLTAVNNNIYLRDLLDRRNVVLSNRTRSDKVAARAILRYEPPEAELLLGPALPGEFMFEGVAYPYNLTLWKAHDTELILKGDERTSGLLIIAGTAVLDCQFLRFENQLGTEYLFGRVSCPALAEMLSRGRAVISDERDGLNLKEPFVAAFAQSVSTAIEPLVQKERSRLSHLDHATTSKRTHFLIAHLLQRMNSVATDDLGILLPPRPASVKSSGPTSLRPPVLRFSTPFYYRKANRLFHVTLLVDKSRLLDRDIIVFTYELPPRFRLEPLLNSIEAGELSSSGRLEFSATCDEIGAAAKIMAATGPYEARCEVVIAAEDTGREHLSGTEMKSPGLAADAAALFRGYELRNLENDVERAVYSEKERLILINTEAPTVRLYVDGQGYFKDGARLLLAELFLDVISGELALLYVDRTTQKGDSLAYQQAKQNFIKKFGVEIHKIMLGNQP